jgi:hypothetical protein
MAQMEKFQMHRVQPDLLDHKEHLALLALQDRRDLLAQRAQLDQQVQALELLGLPVQLAHLVLREVLDQQVLRDQRVQLAQQVRLDLPVHKEKLEQLVQRAFLKLQS